MGRWRRSEPDAPWLDRYLRDWRLQSDGSLIETHTSWLLPVRQAGDTAMLKVLKQTSDEQAGAEVLRYFAGAGAVRLLASDAGGLLMERADGDRSLVAMAVSGDDEQAAGILAGCVGQLHGARDHDAPDGLIRLSNWFLALFERQAQLPVLTRCADIARRLLATERETVVLHGDLHHDNVLHSARGWLAIDPKGLIGERTYEVANLLCNPQPYGDIVHRRERMLRLAMLYAERLGLDVQRVLGFALAHAGLSAAWSLQDGRDAGYRVRCAEVLDPLVA
jgi:streptomycin 6-kinase